jgi:ribose transport system substrate-binding protein
MARKGKIYTVFGVLVLILILVASCTTPPPATQEAGNNEALAEAQAQIAELQAQLEAAAEEGGASEEEIAALQAELEDAQAAAEAVATPEPSAEGVGEILPNYLFEEGTVLLTPQYDLVDQVEVMPDYTVENGEDYHFVFITKHHLNPYFVAATQGAQRRCEEMGVRCDFYAPEKPDNPEEQIRMIEDAINQGVDGILVYAVDSRAVSPALQKANEAGIPIVGLGTVAFDVEHVTFISADYYGRTYEMGHLLADRLGGTGNVVTIDGVPGAQNAKDMRAGYLDALSEYQNIQVLASQTGYWKRLEGLAAMENLLQRYPEIDGVVGADDESALGAVQALESAGYVPGEDVFVVGFNATHDAVCAIREGRLYASDNADPGGLAGSGMEFLVRHVVDGENFPPEIPWPLPQDRYYVTTENIDEYWPIAWALSDEEKAAGECLD